MSTTTRKSSRSLLTALVATPMLLLALAACSTGGASSAAPSEASAGNQAAEGEIDAARDAYDLKLVECIRGKGFDIADPKPGEGFDSTDPDVRAAGLDCMTEIGDPPTARGVRMTPAEQMKGLLEDVDCLRKKGYTVEDPTVETGFTMPDEVTDADLNACVGS